jgi:hypothetical protein
MRATRLRAVLAVVSVAALVATACGGEVEGEPSPAPNDDGAVGGGEAGQRDVPSVEEPLDIRAFLDDPCALLSREWAKQEDLEDIEEAEESVFGTSCSWSSPPVLPYGVQIIVADPENEELCQEGLQCAYDAFERGRLEYYEPTAISGYPAAFAGSADRRDRGQFVLDVGVADDQSVTVIGTSDRSDPERAEELAVSAAEEMIKTLREGK